MKKIPFIKQIDQMDCGPACLQIISKYYGRNFSLQKLRERCYCSRKGVSLLGISDAAESIGLRSMGVEISFRQLVREAPLPCIAYWQKRHFVVIYEIKRTKVRIADPAFGYVSFSIKDFLINWGISSDEGESRGICLFLDPSPEFYRQNDEPLGRVGFRFLSRYFLSYKKLIFHLLFLMFVGSILQFIFPFLTQAIVDVGIKNNHIDFIYLILMGQLVFFISRLSIDFVRNWIQLHIGARINISLISDFLIKLLKLPIGYFDSKTIGDIMHRIDDHGRIQLFLISTFLKILISLTSFLIFGIVLMLYDLRIFVVFVSGSVIYTGWLLLFVGKRKKLDYKRFHRVSENLSLLYQIINGIQEIKLNNCERQKRWGWERLQAKIFKISIDGLAFNQYQQSGGAFINEAKNILISFLSATAVIEGKMTLGMMLSVQYIIGQLNSPIGQFIEFIHSTQDAKISLDRCTEIYQQEDEEPLSKPIVNTLPGQKNIHLTNVSFQYEGPRSQYALKNIDLLIPANKVTAVVGPSGSGKTTLVKIILGFYSPINGEIQVGDFPLKTLSVSLWRQNCGVVMQDGYIFSDTIANNISLCDEVVDHDKLINAVKIANIQEFIESLPLGYETKIGIDGQGLSQGQKQRILIARVVYKNPAYIFFDEATNALDASNEKVIMDNLKEFFISRTVIIVAHRLSTVKNADQIIVLDSGRIVEYGNHCQLITQKEAYFNLIKNQLELGN